MTLGDFAIFVAVLGLWFSLNRWILPWMGIPTCMAGACSAGPQEPASGDDVEEPEALTFSSPYPERPE